MKKRTDGKKLNLSRVALVFLIFIFLNLFIIFFIKLNNNKKNNINYIEEIINDNFKDNIISENYSNNDIEFENNYEKIILENNQEDVLINTQKNNPDISININVAGDIITHNSNFKDAHNLSDDSYDFSYVFENIQDYFDNADLNIGTLESNFAGRDKGYSNYPLFNAPEDMAVDLKELGFDVLATAHNHCLDKGYSGLVNTLNELDNAGIEHLGTYADEESSNEYLVKDVKGIKIGFLDYTYDTNGISPPAGKEYCVNMINVQNILNDLENLQKMNLDLIVVIMHWGEEYRTNPTQQQRDLADMMFKNGADIILGSHTHCLEPMEIKDIKLEDGTIKKGYVIYSLGNFMSGQYMENTRQTVLLDIKVTKNGTTNKTSIDCIHYTPIYMLNYFSGGEGAHNFRLLDIEAEIARYDSGDTIIGSGLYNTLVSEVNHIYNVLGPEIDIK